MTKKQRDEIGVMFTQTGNCMRRFRAAVQERRVDYALAASDLLNALEWIARMEKALRDAKASETFPERN